MIPIEVDKVKEAHNEALSTFGREIKRLLKEKKEQGEWLTATDIDRLRRTLEYRTK